MGDWRLTALCESISPHAVLCAYRPLLGKVKASTNVLGVFLELVTSLLGFLPKQS